MENITKDELSLTIREGMLSLLVYYSKNDKMNELDNINVKKIIDGTMIFIIEKLGAFDERDIADMFLNNYPVVKFDNDYMIVMFINFIKANIENAKEIINMLDMEENEENISRIVCLAYVIDMLIENHWYIKINLKSKVGVEIKKYVKNLM